jgi:hypothetical protein
LYQKFCNWFHVTPLLNAQLAYHCRELRGLSLYSDRRLGPTPKDALKGSDLGTCVSKLEVARPLEGTRFFIEQRSFEPTVPQSACPRYNNTTIVKTEITRKTVSATIGAIARLPTSAMA